MVEPIGFVDPATFSVLTNTSAQPTHVVSIINKDTAPAPRLIPIANVGGGGGATVIPIGTQVIFYCSTTGSPTADGLSLANAVTVTRLKEIFASKLYYLTGGDNIIINLVAGTYTTPEWRDLVFAGGRGVCVIQSNALDQSAILPDTRFFNMPVRIALKQLAFTTTTTSTAALLIDTCPSGVRVDTCKFSSLASSWGIRAINSKVDIIGTQSLDGSLTNTRSFLFGSNRGEFMLTGAILQLNSSGSFTEGFVNLRKSSLLVISSTFNVSYVSGSSASNYTGTKLICDSESRFYDEALIASNWEELLPGSTVGFTFRGLNSSSSFLTTSGGTTTLSSVSPAITIYKVTTGGSTSTIKLPSTGSSYHSDTRLIVNDSDDPLDLLLVQADISAELDGGTVTLGAREHYGRYAWFAIDKANNKWRPLLRRDFNSLNSAVLTGYSEGSLQNQIAYFTYFNILEPRPLVTVENAVHSVDGSPYDFYQSPWFSTLNVTPDTGNMTIRIQEPYEASQIAIYHNHTSNSVIVQSAAGTTLQTLTTGQMCRCDYDSGTAKFRCTAPVTYTTGS